MIPASSAGMTVVIFFTNYATSLWNIFLIPWNATVTLGTKSATAKTSCKQSPATFADVPPTTSCVLDTIVKVKATKVTTSIITIGTQSIQPRLKAVVNLVKAHKTQVLNYLKAAKSDVGLLVNFGESSLKWERITRFEKKGQSVAADIVI